MKYLKIVLFVLLIIVVGVGIVAGVFAAQYLYNQNQYGKKQAKVFEPLIEIPENPCGSEGDSIGQNLYASVSTNNLEKLKESFESLVRDYQGSITSRNQYDYPSLGPQPGLSQSIDFFPPPPTGIDKRLASNYLSFSGTVPSREADRFIEDFKKLVVAPARFESFNVDAYNQEYQKQNCETVVDNLRGLQRQEELYLVTLQKTKDPVAVESISKSLTQIRQEAQGYKFTLQDFKRGLNRLNFNVTIQETR